MMKEIDVCYIKLFLRIDLEKFNRLLLRNGNFQFNGVTHSNLSICLYNKKQF